MSFNILNDRAPEDDPNRYAGFSVRALAALIDGVIFIPAIGLSTYNQLSIKSLTLELSLIVIVMLYKPLMEWKYQATLGKVAMKIKVIAEIGGPMTLLQSFVRSSIFVASSVISALIAFAVFNNPGFAEVKTVEDIVAFAPYMSYSSAHDSLMFIIIMSVSFLIFDPRHQGVHDKMGRTLVVY